MRARAGTGQGIIWGLIAAASLVLACKDDAPSEGNAPNAIATTICRWHFECDCDETINLYSSEENCRLEIASAVQSAIDEANMRELTYQGACVEAVIAALNDIQCASLVDFFTRPELVASADDLTRCKIYFGDREPGESCEVLPDDFYGDDCVADAECVNGVCRAFQARLGPGEDCNATADECEVGLLCIDINGGTQTKCEDLPSGGETCKGTADLCDLEYYCEQSSKTCTALPGPGSECAPFPSLAQQRCNAAGVCNVGTNMCDPAPEGGEACVAKCAEGWACDAGVCVTAPAVVCSAGA